VRISVVIPAHNAAAFIAEALASVFAQTRPVDEVIVVDDESTDGTADVAGAHPVRLVRTGRQSGPAGARNRGIEAASGEVVAFLDADDVWEPDHIAVVGGLLERHPAAAVAFARVATLGERAFVLAGEHPDGVAFDARAELIHDNFIGQAAALVRRDVLAAVGGYDVAPEVAYAEDYDLWLRIADRWPFVGDHRVTVRYREHVGQRSREADRPVAARWVARRRCWRRADDAGRGARPRPGCCAGRGCTTSARRGSATTGGGSTRCSATTRSCRRRRVRRRRPPVALAPRAVAPLARGRRRGAPAAERPPAARRAGALRAARHPAVASGRQPPRPVTAWRGRAAAPRPRWPVGGGAPTARAPPPVG
jgi:hypothetical protein